MTLNRLIAFTAALVLAAGAGVAAAEPEESEGDGAERVAVTEPAPREGESGSPGGERDEEEGEGREFDPLPEPPQLRGFDYNGTPPVVRQAGAGGGKTYGHAGVVELGGSATLTGAANYTQIGINPRAGYFLMDNFEVSAILGLNHISAPNAGMTIVSLMAEPSVHVPMTHAMFGFVGFGVGPSYAEDSGFGVSFAPRIGLNFLVGRSGIITPALHVQHNTHEASATAAGGMVDVGTSYGLGVDFSVMY